MPKGKPASVKTSMICLAECTTAAVCVEKELAERGPKNEIINVWQMADGTCGKPECRRFLVKLKCEKAYVEINTELCKTDTVLTSPHLTSALYISACKAFHAKIKLVVKGKALQFMEQHTPPPSAAEEQNIAVVAQLQERVHAHEDDQLDRQRRVTELLRGNRAPAQRRTRTRARASDEDDEPEASPPPRRARRTESVPPPSPRARPASEVMEEY